MSTIFRSACKYFATLYKGESDPVQAWKALNTEEKRKYEEELVKKKQAYIVEFEKFLKSLSKEELEAFSRSRQQQVQSDDVSNYTCSQKSRVGYEKQNSIDHERIYESTFVFHGHQFSLFYHVINPKIERCL
jgi:hypothetical protein